MGHNKEQGEGKDGIVSLAHDPKKDERLEEEQHLLDVLEDDEVREALKRLHAGRPNSGGAKPA